MTTTSEVSMSQLITEFVGALANHPEVAGDAGR